MKQLPSLYGLRAVSITFVILNHLSHFNFHIDLDIIPLFNGQFGVNIFFVISGFLITSLLLAEETKTGSISLSNFYLRRTLRIFPAFYFLLLIYFILQLIGYLHIPLNAWLTALTYTKHFNPRIDFYTSHAWSLSIEETFYLLWPFIFILGDKTRKDAAVYLILVVPLIRLYVSLFPVSWITDLSFFTRIDSIATGCYLAMYKNKAVEMVAGNWNLFFFSAIALLFIVPWLAHVAQNTYLNILFIAFGVLSGTIANILIAFIILYSVYGPHGYWHKILNSKPFAYVGILSYSLYLWQQLFVKERSWWVTHFPQNVFCIILTSMLSYYLIERPFLRLKSNFLKTTLPADAHNPAHTFPLHSTSKNQP